MKASWDIFCSVVDNYGDIGVTWRLARQLVAEHGWRCGCGSMICGRSSRCALRRMCRRRSNGSRAWKFASGRQHWPTTPMRRTW
jgi:hypothetical protein